MTHKPPTPEELQANIDQTIKDLEADTNVVEKETEDKPKEDKKKEKKVEPKEEVKVEPKKEEKVDETSEEEEKVVTPEDKQKDIDYKKKFVDSSREAQILHAQTNKLSEAIEQASQVPEPTDEEMSAKYTDWELMDNATKILAKDNEKNKRALGLLTQVNQETKDIKAWNGKVDDFVTDPKTLIDHPELEGKVDDFKIFASRPTRRAVDFETLVSAFMFEAEKDKPKNKGSMLEKGNGGPNNSIKPKNNKITIEQAAILRQTNYNEYRRLSEARMIDLDIE